ncbi:MAG TPA: hypothetical protein VL126_12235 [Bacteroidota bacterium]|nr:hypothetical protein [Bacteroidota bacterium]
MPKLLGMRLAAVALFLVAHTPGYAQYFDQVRTYVPSDARYADVGVFARDFSPRPSNTAPESLKVSYKRLMPTVELRQGPVEIQFGYTTYPLEGGTRSAIFLGFTLTGEYVLSGNRMSALVLPLLLTADFTKSGSAGSLHDDFNVASVGIGTGLRYRTSGSVADFTATVAGVIHYSFEGYSVHSGSSPAVIGEAVAVLPQVPILDGIVLGYRFRYQIWSLEQGYFDYRTINHGLFIGVLF